MPRIWQVRIVDILDAIAKIEQYVEGLDREAFEANEMIVDAVLRNLEIIGETTRHLPAAATDKYSDVPWANIRALRNIIAHEYFGVNRPIIWETIERRLPELRERLREGLDDEPDGLG